MSGFRCTCRPGGGVCPTPDECDVRAVRAEVPDLMEALKRSVAPAPSPAADETIEPPLRCCGQGNAETCLPPCSRSEAAEPPEGLREAMDALDNVGAFDHSNDEARDREYIRATLAPLLDRAAKAEAAAVEWAVRCAQAHQERDDARDAVERVETLAEAIGWADCRRGATHAREACGTAACPCAPSPAAEPPEGLRAQLAQAIVEAGDGYWARADAALAVLAPLLDRAATDRAAVERVRKLVAFYDRHEYSSLNVDDVRWAMGGDR